VKLNRKTLDEKKEIEALKKWKKEAKVGK